MIPLQVAIIASLAIEAHGWKRKSISQTLKSRYTLFQQPSFLGQVPLMLITSAMVFWDQHKLPSL